MRTPLRSGSTRLGLRTKSILQLFPFLHPEDLRHAYTDIYNQAEICYYQNANGPPPPLASQCPASLGYAPAAMSGLGDYSSKQHFLYGDVTWKPSSRVTASVGYAGTFVGGNTLAIDPLQVPGTLAFNYQKPYARAIFDLGKGFSCRMTWNYYGYNGNGWLPTQYRDWPQFLHRTSTAAQPNSHFGTPFESAYRAGRPRSTSDSLTY
jgi:hypothetical protein